MRALIREGEAVSVAELFESASPEARALVTTLLEQDVADRDWAAQVGPCLTQADAARLLGKSEQATAKDARLLRVKTRSGRVAYPVVQFEGRGVLPGIGAVLAIVAPVADALTILAWLTGTQRALGGRRPVDALRDGDADDVIALASRFARSAA
ncbi:MAG: hypothetical protein ACR2KP_20770 [Egibacteraceae bacterium]